MAERINSYSGEQLETLVRLAEALRWQARVARVFRTFESIDIQKLTNMIIFSRYLDCRNLGLAQEAQKVISTKWQI